MDQKNIQVQISLPFLPNLALKATVFLNHLLMFLQLRAKREYWGIIYDSATKQPLDPVKVSLVYADTGKVESSCITDLEGRYGFLARVGKFKILAQRTNYIFPSQIVKGDKDGIYSDLYHGEFFVLNKASEVVAPNIPMDPVAADWNQTAKQRLVWKNFYPRWFLEKLITVILWFGFIYAGTMSALTYFKSEVLSAVLGAYLLVFILELIAPNSRLFGLILDSRTLEPVFGAKLVLTNPKVPGVAFGSSLSREDGKFFLRANPGPYALKISDPETGRDYGEVLVRVGRAGVINATVLIESGLTRL